MGGDEMGVEWFDQLQAARTPAEVEEVLVRARAELSPQGAADVAHVAAMMEQWGPSRGAKTEGS